MKALLCEKYGPPESLTYRDIEDPKMDDNLVLVDIYSASVNFPDVLMISLSSKEYFEFMITEAFN